MGVDIDKAGDHDLAGRVNLFAALSGDMPDSGNYAAVNRNVGSKSWVTGAIDHGSAANDQIMHIDSPQASSEDSRINQVIKGCAVSLRPLRLCVQKMISRRGAEDAEFFYGGLFGRLDFGAFAQAIAC
jgi:hypothetical protein